VEVVSSRVEKIVLRAPLAPNINHRETVFGGSASALAILAAWSLLHVRLQSAGISSRLVIQQNTMRYTRPIPTVFEAIATMEDIVQWQRFLHILERKQRARIAVVAVLTCEGERVGELSGDFVALGYST
jgi:thioesterase domain-containing protein